MSPAAEVKRNDAVVVKAKDGLSIARFVKKTPKRVELKAIGSDGDEP